MLVQSFLLPCFPPFLSLPPFPLSLPPTFFSLTFPFYQQRLTFLLFLGEALLTTVLPLTLLVAQPGEESWRVLSDTSGNESCPLHDPLCSLTLPRETGVTGFAYDFSTAAPAATDN